MTDNMFEQLAAEFPRETVHWRAQTLTGDGKKALALAYIDARHVMDRLDEVCGSDGWSDSYVETARGRVIASIAIKTPTEGWVTKSDGAGDTDVEGEKGGMSDAFKRAAVKWGIGRYLYRMPSVWAPCETRESNGKRYWKSWVGSPWDCIGGSAPKALASPTIDDGQYAELVNLSQAAKVSVGAICDQYQVASLEKLPANLFGEVADRLRRTIETNQQRKAA